MGTINDSDAFLNKDRMLVQHQAALSILQGKLDNPALESYNWLDLGCGKGQIIINLEENFGEESLKKINYFAFDLKDDYLNITLKKAESLKFKKFEGKTADISDFSKLYPSTEKFDFITLTNSIHELTPLQLSNILFETTLRLSEKGILFIYDMESLSNRELGAITWKADEIHRVLKAFLQSVGIDDYSPRPGRWTHSTCKGWNIQLQREFLKKSDEELIRAREKIFEITNNEISETLYQKLDECSKTLESFTKHGSETGEEEILKLDLLYNYWALNRNNSK